LFWRSPKPGRHLRWWIIATCFLATTINYLDRQCLSVAAPTVSKEFGFSNVDYSSMVNSFLIAYTVMQAVSGRIVDWIGVRWGLALFVAWWSVAGILHAWANGLSSFRLFRFLLGMGEAGNWPAATRVVAEWFPARERGLAVAIFDSGSAVGGFLAPPLVTWLMLRYGWRSAFLVTGALAAAWLPLWLWLYRTPKNAEEIPQAKPEPALADLAKSSAEAGQSASWRSLMARREVWGIIVGRLLTDCVWWFYVFWLPKYLAEAHGLSEVGIASLAWIPFVAVDIGSLGGGWFSGHLVRRGWTLNASRKALLCLGATGMLAGIGAGGATDASLSVGLIAAATFSYGAWCTIILTLPTDLFSSRQTATVSGLSGTGAGLGGLGFTWLTGVVVDNFSYKPIFVMAGLLPLAALGLVQWLIPNIPAGQPLAESNAGRFGVEAQGPGAGEADRV
jgi:ACS family hexuronate transporter-like MFS transporter